MATQTRHRNRNIKLVKTSKSFEFSYLALALTLLSLLAPIGALAGYFFTEGYLSKYGLNIGVFPQTIQEYIFSSFSTLGHGVKFLTEYLSVKKYVVWIILITILSVYIFILDFIFTWMGKFFSKYLAKRTKPITLNPYTKNLISLSVILSFIPATLLYIPAALIIPAGIASHIGKDVASNEIDNFKGCGDINNEHPCIVYSLGSEKLEEGIVIAQSEKFIALFNGSETKVYAMQPSSVISVFLKPHKTNNQIEKNFGKKTELKP